MLWEQRLWLVIVWRNVFRALLSSLFPSLPPSLHPFLPDTHAGALAVCPTLPSIRRVARGTRGELAPLALPLAGYEGVRFWLTFLALRRLWSPAGVRCTWCRHYMRLQRITDKNQHIIIISVDIWLTSSYCEIQPRMKPVNYTANTITDLKG